jgi:hypothetical protein
MTSGEGLYRSALTGVSRLFGAEDLKESNVLQVLGTRSEPLGQNEVIQSGQNCVHSGRQIEGAASTPDILEGDVDPVHRRDHPRHKDVDLLQILEDVAPSPTSLVGRSSRDESDGSAARLKASASSISIQKS